MRPQVSVHSDIEFHGQRSQQLNVGVDPMVFANMVAKSNRIIQESDDKVRSGFGELSPRDL